MKKKPIPLTGAKPLWDNLKTYLDFVQTHEDEIYDWYRAGDENAELIVQIISLVPLAGEKARDTLMIVIERYIHDHHADLAVIVGGYAR